MAASAIRWSSDYGGPPAGPFACAWLPSVSGPSSDRVERDLESENAEIVSVDAQSACQMTSIVQRGPEALARRASEVKRVACMTSAKAT